MKGAKAAVYVGIGGWNFPPWRGTFYPPGLPQAQELAYASARLTSIEINGTFYRTQTPASFSKWRQQTPDGFVFAVKAPRYGTHRRELGESRDTIVRFLDSGLAELGEKLGPILWQFPPTRQFTAEGMTPFLELLPRSHAGVGLRHVIEARHRSFASAEWMALAREAGVAQAIVESEKHVLLGDLTADFVYARLERNSEAEAEGYDPVALDAWAERIRRWSAGQAVTDLPTVGPAAAPKQRPCFVYFISGDKVRAPTAAMAMLRRLGQT